MVTKNQRLNIFIMISMLINNLNVGKWKQMCAKHMIYLLNKKIKNNLQKFWTCSNWCKLLYTTAVYAMHLSVKEGKLHLLNLSSQTQNTESFILGNGLKHIYETNCPKLSNLFLKYSHVEILWFCNSLEMTMILF